MRTAGGRSLGPSGFGRDFSVSALELGSPCFGSAGTQDGSGVCQLGAFAKKSAFAPGGRQYRRRGFDLEIVAEVLSNVDSMAAKAGVIADVGNTVEKVVERNALEGRRVDEPCKGEFDPGQDYLRPAVGLHELDLGQPIAMEGSQRRLATLPEAELEDMVVTAVPKLELEVQSMTTMAQISEDQHDWVGRRSYLHR
jgi:hypothetical protein